MAGKDGDRWEEETRRAREAKRMEEEEAGKRKKELEEAKEEEKKIKQREEDLRGDLQRLQEMVHSMTIKLEKAKMESDMAHRKTELCGKFCEEAVSRR